MNALKLTKKMNKHNAKKFLPIIQALADDKAIQYRIGHELWHDIEWVDTIEEDSSDYRIKPEPRTFEIVVSKLSRGIYDARDWHGTLPDDGDPQWEHVTVQEVLQ